MHFGRSKILCASSRRQVVPFQKRRNETIKRRLPPTPRTFSRLVADHSSLTPICLARALQSRTRQQAQAKNIEFTRMEERFVKMHELSRHVIHTMETLQVTARTLASIRNHHSRCHKPYEAGADRSNTDDNASNNNAAHRQECNENECIPEMLFYQEFIENLRLRAGAFNERMGNEILLVRTGPSLSNLPLFLFALRVTKLHSFLWVQSFHLSSADDNITAKQILQDGRNDGRELTQLVSTATLLFLPGTFVSVSQEKEERRTPCGFIIIFQITMTGMLTLPFVGRDSTRVSSA